MKTYAIDLCRCLVAFVVCCALGACAGGSDDIHASKKSGSQFIRAEIQTFSNGEQVTKSAEGGELKELAEKFPHLGSGRRSHLQGLWLSLTQISFVRKSGDVAVVDINSDYTRWREGAGDWPLDPSVRKLLVELPSRATTRNGAATR